VAFVNVSLTPELERFLHRKVASGRYNSASEVVREALRVLEQNEQIRRIEIEGLRMKIKEGLDSLDRGEGIDGDDALRQLRKLSARHRRRVS
jgi:antitoxin ParD1/3/4